MRTRRRLPSAVAALATALLALLAASACGSAARSSGSTSSAVPSQGSGLASTPILSVSTADGRVGYRTFGQGPPVLLIMGFTGTVDGWTPDFIGTLAAHHRVIAMDNAGIGLTSGLPAPLTITAMGDQSAALLQALNTGPATVIGWSMGGMIAQALAADHPKLVSHLVLAATFPGNGHQTPPPTSVIKVLLGATTNPGSALPLLFPAGNPAAQASQAKFISGIVTWSAQEQTPQPVVTAQEGALYSWTTGREPAGARVAGVRVPTLVADGAEDPLVPAANDRTLAALIPNASLVLYPGAAHAFLFQDQADFLSRVEHLSES